MQKQYWQSDMQISFNPLIWFSKNLCSLINNKNVSILFKKGTHPIGIFFGNKALMKEGYITEEHQSNICHLAIETIQKKMNIVEEYFDPLYYYYVYHYEIEHYFSYNDKCELSNIDKACIFYCCYGFFRNISMKFVNVLQYVASYPDLINKFGVDEINASKLFFSNGNCITFDPIVYVASNLTNQTIKEFINCAGYVDEQRAVKHYIRKGFNEKLSYDSFDEWKYLANNPNRINKILPRSKGKVEYDVFTLTKRKIASDFIKHYSYQNVNRFNPIKFVKRYIDSEYVNKNKKLNIHNAAEYFVKYYVISEKVRYECSVLYQLTIFLQNVIIDDAKHIQYSAIRYIVETNFL
jgi:hypothetical protein